METKNNPLAPVIAKVSANESAKGVRKPRKRKGHWWPETDGEKHPVTLALGVKAALPEGFTEHRISDCQFGCKVYKHTDGREILAHNSAYKHTDGREILAHNSAYGCRVGA